MGNPFDKFKPVETVHHIESLGAEVTLRQLTVKEVADATAAVIKEVDKDGNPIMDFKALSKIKLLKVSQALVKPKMTVSHLETLSKSASEVIDEIINIVDPIVDVDEGNSPDKS